MMMTGIVAMLITLALTGSAIVASIAVRWIASKRT